jgi:hypothetical protein
MHMNIYFFFSKFEYFMYFLVDRFFGPVFFRFRSGSHFWGDGFVIFLMEVVEP